MESAVKIFCILAVLTLLIDYSNCDSLAQVLEQLCSDVECKVKQPCEEGNCAASNRKQRTLMNDEPNVGNESEIKEYANIEVSLGNVKVRQTADYSFIYKDQVYRPDCVPYTPVMEPGTRYPSFESCRFYYVIAENRLDTVLTKCANGTIYSHGQGCVETESIPEDCDDRSSFFCTDTLDPIPFVNEEGISVYNYIGVEFTHRCAPWFVGKRGVGDRFASIEFCNDYYTVVGEHDYTLSTCPTGKVFNRMSARCEYGMPCYQFYHLCNDFKDI